MLCLRVVVEVNRGIKRRHPAQCLASSSRSVNDSFFLLSPWTRKQNVHWFSANLRTVVTNRRQHLIFSTQLAILPVCSVSRVVLGTRRCKRKRKLRPSSKELSRSINDEGSEVAGLSLLPAPSEADVLSGVWEEAEFQRADGVGLNVAGEWVSRMEGAVWEARPH